MVTAGLRYWIRLIIVGGVMGVANIIPGVSGGTMAVVFGIYEDLMEALGNFITDRERRWVYIRFLLILFTGAIVAILSLAKALTWSFDHYPLITLYFFMGLILGSIPVVVRTHEDMRFQWSRGLALMVGIALVVALAILQGGGNETAKASIDYRNFAFVNYLYFTLSGALAASAMIIPGISGSFILLMLGAYRTVLDALSQLSDALVGKGITTELQVPLLILAALSVGVVIGILGFARLMSWALKHYPAITMYLILGLLIGSFYQIYPGFEISWNGAGACLTFIAGMLISLKFGEKK